MRRQDRTRSSGLGRKVHPLRLGIVLATCLATVACASSPQPADSDTATIDQPNDPLEPLNRVTFQFNEALDTLIIAPVAVMYKDLTPPIFQTGVNNFLENLRSPVILANDLFQGQTGRAGTTVVRFLINTTIGVAGIGDPAKSFGYKRHEEDFGQTLAVWGSPEGPYLVLPVLGPSNPRDTAGIVVDMALDPVNWWLHNTHREGLGLLRAGVSGINTRARNYDTLEDVKKSSLDYYATLRSLYRQRRNDEIRNGAPSAPSPGLGQMPDFRDPETAGGK